MADETPRGLASPLGAPGESPEERAQFFLQLLDDLGQQGSPELKRLKSQLIQMVSDYRGAEDKKQASERLGATVAELEMQVANLLLRSVRKMRDALAQQTRRAGTKGPTAMTLRKAAQGFTDMVEALEKMLEAARSGDAKLRKEAQAAMERAREGLQGLQ